MIKKSCYMALGIATLAMIVSGCAKKPEQPIAAPVSQTNVAPPAPVAQSATMPPAGQTVAAPPGLPQTHDGTATASMPTFQKNPNPFPAK